MSLARATARPLTVTFDDTQYLVGANIDRHTRPIHRMDFDRFTDSPELRADWRMLLEILYQIIERLEIPKPLTPIENLPVFQPSRYNKCTQGCCTAL